VTVGEAGSAERVVAGRVRSGVVLRSVPPSCGGDGGLSGSVIATESAIATNTAASAQTGARTNKSGTTILGRSHPPRVNHKRAANTTITAVNSHQGYPKLSTPTLPPTGADNVSRARGAREQALPVVRGSGVTARQTFGNGRITFLR
jgi:hypothetical protein